MHNSLYMHSPVLALDYMNIFISHVPWTMTQEACVESVDQDQIAQNVQSDLWSTMSTVPTQDYD